MCFALSPPPRSGFSHRWLCGCLINCTSSNTGVTKDVAMGLEEGKTPLKPVSLLKKGWSCCTLICQSENNAKELKSCVGLLWGESNNSIGLSESAVWINSS